MLWKVQRNQSLTEFVKWIHISHRSQMQNDEEWFRNIPESYLEKLIYKSELDDIVIQIENGKQNQ